jgi:hypothetical protein
MKRAASSAEATRNLDLLISKLSENEILNLQTMSFVKGGDPDEGNGNEPIIIIPKPL